MSDFFQLTLCNKVLYKNIYLCVIVYYHMIDFYSDSRKKREKMKFSIEFI